MDVVFTLGKLFFSHDRVVVNGLGVFTTETEKVYVHPVEHSFSPEFKKIKFQANKNINDSLLAESMGVDNADELIAEFVENTQAVLKEGNKVQLKNIGFLYLHQTGEIILEQDRSFNYVKKNFGLQGFIQQPVNKIVASEEPEVLIAPKKERRKPKVYLYFLWSAAIILAILAFWKMDAIKSFFNEVPGKSIAETKPSKKQIAQDPKQEQTAVVAVDTVKQDEVAQDTLTDVATDSLENPAVTEPVEEPKNEVAEEQKSDTQVAVEEEKPQGPVYYVIAGCFRSEYKANRLLKDLKANGFEDASIEGKTPGGLIRVCYASYPKRRQASNYMLKLQNQGRKGVWIQKGN
jgi:hypothetical protein